MGDIQRFFKPLMEPFHRFNAAKDATCHFQCRSEPLRILCQKFLHLRLFNIEPQCLLFIVGWIHLLQDYLTNTVFKFLHPFGVTADTGQPVANHRIAGCRVRHNVHRCFIQPRSSRRDEEIGL